MLLDLKLSGRSVVVVGGGMESYKKVLNLLEENPKVKVYSKTFSEGFRKLETEGKVVLVETEVRDVDVFLKELVPKPLLLIAATDNPSINAELALKAKAEGCLVYAIDNPSISDLAFPARASIGDVKVAVSTGGKSPAMARFIMMKFKEAVKPEHLLQIELSQLIRKILREKVKDYRLRREIISKVLFDRRVNELIKAGNFDAAYTEALKIIEGYPRYLEMKGDFNV
ncbi:MAG: bifunctional precorrin-2 dehydrogenase/sirohydrochlorin ferrochelatase [Candidatus Bathyarchaeia archaeon]